MFSGIVEDLGTIVKVEERGRNKDLIIYSYLAQELKIDQSIAHNGVCLTVVDIHNQNYRVTAVEETLKVSNIGLLKEGDHVNLERSLRMSDRIDGHMVQGHVDDVSEVMKIEEFDGSWKIRFNVLKGHEHLMVHKGSICLNGVSLTISALEEDFFEVTIVPYTFENTNFKYLRSGAVVNVEFDILGKYISRYLDIKN